MSSRLTDISDLQTFLTYGNNEITKILQSLQWNRQTLNSIPVVTCSHDAAHKIPHNKLKEHEECCWLKNQDYSKEDKLFPTFPDDTPTLVKLNSEDIKKIIDKASKNDPEFNKAPKCPCLTNEKYFIKVLGKSWNGPQPLTLERLQAIYTADERRAIYDEVVATNPTCHDLSDLALLNANEMKTEKKSKSRLEILAELRDMRRRRTKYRVAAKTKKYSDVLRDVIKTQMDMYTGTHSEEQLPDETSHSHKKLQNDNESLSIETSNKRKQKFHQEVNSYKSSNSRDERKFEKERNTSFINKKKGSQYDERNRSDRYDAKYERTYDKNTRHEKLHNERVHYRGDDRKRYRDRSARDYIREERPVSHSKRKEEKKGTRYVEKRSSDDTYKSYNNCKRVRFGTPAGDIKIKEEGDDHYESGY